MIVLRRERIRELLATKPFVKLSELEEMFPEVSAITLRRDIEYFEKKGEAIKVRGGARSMRFITTTYENTFSKRLTENMQIKSVLAKEAVKYMETGCSIFFDAGTTLLKMATYIPDERYLITTSAPNIALELVKRQRPIVNLTGGMLNRESLSLSGMIANDSISSLNIDIAFLSPSGFTVHDGFTSGNYSECEFKRLLVSKAHRKIMLADSSKIGHILPYTFAQMKDIDVLIIDSPLPANIASVMKNNHVEVVIADPMTQGRQV